MREFFIRYLKDGTGNAVFHFARMFNDRVVTLSTRRNNFWIFNLDHGILKAYQVVCGTVELTPKGCQLHIALLESSI